MNKQMAYRKLLDVVKENRAIVTASKIHEDIPTIHDIAGEYHSSVRHLGFGLFRGETPDGSFTFDAGRAMRTMYDEEGKYILSWTPLSASPEVLAELGYNMDAVRVALEGLCG